MILPEWIHDYRDIPFEEADCYELVRRIYKGVANIEIPDFSGEYKDYKDSKNIKKLYEQEEKNWVTIFKNDDLNSLPDLPDSSEINELDVFIIRILNMPWHIGVVIQSPYIFHTEKKIDGVIEKYNGSTLRNRIIAIKRHKLLS